MQTDRTLLSHKPDIIIRDNKQGTLRLIDFAIVGDRNVVKKEAEKITKYKDLIIDIQRMWNVKTKDNCSRIKIIQKVPEQHTGKYDIKELQKTAILGTAHKLTYKYKTVSMGSNITCTVIVTTE